MLRNYPGHTPWHTPVHGEMSCSNMMEKALKIITLDEKNIADEHICCAMSDKKCAEGYNLKKDWLKKQFPRGFVFKKFNVKHKVFIEYVPAENAWTPYFPGIRQQIVGKNEFVIIHFFYNNQLKLSTILNQI